MRRLLYIILAIIIVLFIVGIYFFSITEELVLDERTYPDILNLEHYSISEIKANNFSSGQYNTEGYVVKIYGCPKCPSGAKCEPCMGPNIVISEQNKILESYTLTDQDLIIFVKNPKQFRLGSYYVFSIIVLDRETTSEPINNVELLAYSNEQSSVDCTSWFDGCNTCEVINGKIGQCTKKSCMEYEKPRCLA